MSPIIFSSCLLKLVSLSSNERNEVTSSSSDLNSNIEKKLVQVLISKDQSKPLKVMEKACHIEKLI